MQQSNLEELFRVATANHQAGKLADAERGYRQVVAADENCAPAWHLLGVLAIQQERFSEAVEHIRRAIRIGMGPDAYGNLGEALRGLNRFDEAIIAYQTAISMDADYATAHGNLGAALNEAGRYAEAIAPLERALQLRPDHPTTLFNYGVALEKVGRREQAIDQWENVLRLVPGHVQTMYSLGVALHTTNRWEQAAGVLRKVVAQMPNFAEAHANLARALALSRQIDDALVHAQRAIELEPDKSMHHSALGVVYSEAKRYDEAVAATERAIELNPKNVAAIGNLGSIKARMNRPVEAEALLERAFTMRPTDAEIAGTLSGAQYNCGRLDKALKTLDQALKLHPNDALLHRNRSIVLLALNRYAEGFEEYEWRWRCDAPEHNPPRDFAQPLWDGSDPTGRTILLHCEQGYGDVIEFARYIPMMVETGAKVIVEVLPTLRELIATAHPTIRVVPKSLNLPDFDLQIPLMSLARIFKTTVDTIPAGIPYLHPDEARIVKWKPIIDSHRRRLNVGLVWGGNAIPDPRRSIALKELAPLAEVKDASWFSLQMGPQRDELNYPPPGMQIIDIGKDLKDFADSAAVLSMLDLLVTIDTGIAHLGGALGVRTWTLLPDAADWRWLMSGESTPWYPQMRLFRQEKLASSWKAAVANLASALRELD